MIPTLCFSIVWKSIAQNDLINSYYSILIFNHCEKPKHVSSQSIIHH